MPKKTPTASAGADARVEEDFKRQILEYKSIDDEIKALTKRKDALKESLKEQLTRFGKTDINGSVIYEAEFAGKRVEARNTARTSASLVGDALDILKRKELTEYIEMVEIVRTDILDADIAASRISDAVVKELYESKTTYAFSVKVK